MTDPNAPKTASLAAPGPQEGQRALEFARSELFERTFKEGMGLVEETAAYLDGPGRAASKRLSRMAALAYAGESMRLTTKLMQVASWLLVQRAVRDGELPLIEAASDKYRLITREGPTGPALAGTDDLPEALKVLIGRAAALYERVKRLDLTMYDEDGGAPANQVSNQMALLQAAFQKI